MVGMVGFWLGVLGAIRSAERRGPRAAASVAGLVLVGLVHAVLGTDVDVAWLVSGLAILGATAVFGLERLRAREPFHPAAQAPARTDFE